MEEWNAIIPAEDTVLYALNPPAAPALTPGGVADRLSRGLPGARAVVPHVSEEDWVVHVEVERPDDEPLVLHLCREPTDPEPVLQSARWGAVLPDDVEAARASRDTLALSGTWSEREPLRDWHLALRALAAAAPCASLLADPASGVVRGFDWVEDAAACPVAPAPTSLYSIHCVTDGGDDAWLHTHGLGRCGRFELEVLDISREEGHLFTWLLQAVAGQMLDDHAPHAGEPFEAGPGLDLVWLPWEDATGYLPREGLGRWRDRDQLHGGARAVLLAPGPSGRLVSPTRHRDLLAARGALFVSGSETRRMRALARERLPVLDSLLRCHREQAGWRFRVKLGAPSCHHVWFDLHALDAAEVAVTPCEAKAGRAHLRPRPRPLESLTDWAIDSPWGHFTPDTIPHLVRRLGGR